MVVRVYRTDKFDYNVDEVDAKVNFADSSLTKLKKTSKARKTPSFDNMDAYSLVNDTRAANNGRPHAFMVLKRLRAGVYEIIFRAEYALFPTPVNVHADLLYWVSPSQSNFYYLNSTGQGIAVSNITGDRRDFSPDNSTWDWIDLSEHLRHDNGTLAPIGKIPVRIVDSLGAVWIPYGDKPTKGCNDGSALFFYNDTTLSYVGDQQNDDGYWLHAPNKWWGYANSNTVNITNWETGEVVFAATFTDAQLQKIISRYSLGAWVGPLAALGGLWVVVTIFLAVVCRKNC